VIRRLAVEPQVNLYYEIHVTIAPTEGEVRDRLDHIVEAHGFRLAKLYMQTGVPHIQDHFATTRGMDYDEVRANTIACVQSLQRMGIEVRRYKIEKTLVDSNKFDAFGLFQPRLNVVA
jgi:hypothetical protein